MAHLISARQLGAGFLDEHFRVADSMYEALAEYGTELGKQRLMGTMFFEPSTRTRLSFEAAMVRLGGSVVGFADPKSSSAAKSESLVDTVRVVGGYADVLVMRHFLDGAARLAADYSPVPFINAGDGRHEHPTQTLTDLFTLHRMGLYGPGLALGLAGDLKYGRTVHSLVKALFGTGAKLYCAAPEALQLPVELVREARAAGLVVEVVDSLAELLPQVQVLYMTRIQRERLAEGEDYEALRGAFVLTRELVEKHNPDVCVLHPLPRVDEIGYAVDKLPAARYFEQAKFGVPARMALVAMLLGLVEWQSDTLPEPAALYAERAATADEVCPNKQCVTNVERFAPGKVYAGEDDRLRCSYCDNVLK